MRHLPLQPQLTFDHKQARAQYLFTVLFKKGLKHHTICSGHHDQQNDRKALLKQIEELNKRMSKDKDPLLSSMLNASDYKAIKSEWEPKINLLEAKLSAEPQKHKDIETILKKAIYNLTRIVESYITGI